MIGIDINIIITVRQQSKVATPGLHIRKWMPSFQMLPPLCILAFFPRFTKGPPSIIFKCKSGKLIIFFAIKLLSQMGSTGSWKEWEWFQPTGFLRVWYSVQVSFLCRLPSFNMLFYLTGSSGWIGFSRFHPFARSFNDIPCADTICNTLLHRRKAFWSKGG